MVKKSVGAYISHYTFGVSSPEAYNKEFDPPIYYLFILLIYRACKIISFISLVSHFPRPEDLFSMMIFMLLVYSACHAKDSWCMLFFS